MNSLKTLENEGDVFLFIENFVQSEQKKKDSFELIKIMQSFTGYEPKMWGPSIIGFGKYSYKSARGTQKGEMPLLAFSPRKAAISLYIYSGLEEHKYLLEDLGKFKIGKICIYIKQLSDINLEAMKKIMSASLETLK